MRRPTRWLALSCIRVAGGAKLPPSKNATPQVLARREPRATTMKDEPIKCGTHWFIRVYSIRPGRTLALIQSRYRVLPAARGSTTNSGVS